MNDLAGLTDLGVVDAASALARHDVSAVELTTACLERIRDVGGVPSHEGDADSINAWVRLYADDALAAAARGRCGAGRRCRASCMPRFAGTGTSTPAATWR